MDIPSLFMIPSAVSSGKVHSVFPNSTDADFDFNRDSSATRVNSQGLIETVGYFGSELVTNGGFDTDSNWTINDWTISNGKLNGSASTGIVFQNSIGTVVGKTYKVTLDITNYVSGSIRLKVGGASYQNISSSVGSKEFLFVAANTDNNILFSVISSFTGSIDNVSVKEVTGDRARLNYEIEGGLVNTKPSLLLEPQSTNLITYSENFSDSSWTITGASIITNNAISPDGTLNATKLVENNSNSQHKIQETSNSIVAGNVVYSQFVKKGERNKVLLELGGGGGGSAKFNLDLAVVISESNVNATITKFSNNWYRCSVSFTSSSSSVYLGTYILDDTESLSYQGDGSSGLYIFGAQLEQLSYATSYIPTNGSAQTRAAETCIGAGTSSIFESSEGILYCEIAALADDSTFRMLSISDGTINNRVSLLYSNTSNTIRAAVNVNTTNQADLNSTDYDITEFHKVAFKYKANDFSLYIDGQEVATDTSGSVFSANTLSKVSFVRGDNNNHFYGKVRDIRVYNTKEMTDSEVDILLTKITS